MTLDTASIALLSRILGELALISVIYGSICRLGLKAVQRQIAHGILFGAAAVVTTMSPIAFSNEVHVDGHIMMLTYSAAFGGPITYFVTAAISILYKLFASLPMTAGSVIALGVTGAIGLSWNFLIKSRLGLSLQSLALLGLMSTSQILLFFLLPFEVAVSMIARTLPVGILIAVLGAVLMGKFIEREMRHIELEDRLACEANTDALTGLQNRRAFELTLETLDRFPDHASVMVVDIDHFKTFNDTFGHETGDEVLKGVGGCLAHTLARRGQAYRTGGDEFAIFLPGLLGKSAFDVAEQIRNSIAKLNLQNVPKQITVSVGIASTSPSMGAIIAVRKADQALYVAKSAGRNRSVNAADLDFGGITTEERSVA